MTRLFVNYNKADQAWADWVAWVLKAAGHEVTAGAWDSGSGMDFAVAMGTAGATSDLTVVLLSEEYLAVEYAQSDWLTAFAGDAVQGVSGLIFVGIGSCQVEGVLGQIPTMDLVGVTQETAREKLLQAVKSRLSQAPPVFPQTAAGQQGSTSSPTTAAMFPPQTLSKQNQANQDVAGDRNVIIGAADTGSNIVINNTYHQAAPESNDAGLEPVDDVGLIDRFLPSRRHKKIAIAAASLIAVSSIGVWLSLPVISARYNQQGQQAQGENELNVAEQKYKRAIVLNSRNADAHYNLATLYEDRSELDLAEAHYSKALEGGFPEAYNNLGRLYLLLPEPRLDKAVSLFEEGVNLAEQQQSFPEIKYTLYKNWGWARLKQGKYDVAEPLLRTAIAISEKPDAVFVVNAGSAHCLLAQVLEGQSQPQDALASWQRCCQEGDETFPEESQWLQEARARLKTEGFDFNQSCIPNAVPVS